jgi:N-ethylmaleimide reductase
MRMSLFEPYSLGDLRLRNRIVMAPMTRNRAPGNVPNELMAEYYRQRASAGLIVTEGVAPSPNALGYARQPGGYSAAQTAGWKKVVDAVHAAGGRIFMQQMHTGRIGHPLNLPKGAELIAPSAVGAAGSIVTDQSGPQPFPVPRALRTDEVAATIDEFVLTSRNAVEAGFDGIELHGANGYLIEQFLQPKSNVRTDAYGGSLENRNRFAVETAAAVAKAIGPGKTGIRLSPFNTFNDLAVYPEIPEQYELLARELGKLKLAYIHIVNYWKVGEPLLRAIKNAFGGPVIVCGELDRAKAEAALAAGYADLAAFAKAFIANPDLPRRLQQGLPLATPDTATFYAGGEKGYADYPALP